jgi:hypothetical protein
VNKGKETVDTKESVKFVKRLIDESHNAKEQDAMIHVLKLCLASEAIKERFIDVVPNLTSKTWEDIWERVRDKFEQKISGVPNGWEIYAGRVLMRRVSILTDDSNQNSPSEPRFRSFECAEEFAPQSHRTLKSGGQSPAYYRVNRFNNLGAVIGSKTKLLGWSHLFKHYVFADDGKPVGMEIG